MNDRDTISKRFDPAIEAAKVEARRAVELCVIASRAGTGKEAAAANYAEAFHKLDELLTARGRALRQMP